MDQQRVSIRSLSFQFATAGRIIFGANSAIDLGELTRELGARALVCTGSHPERHAALLDGLDVATSVFTVTHEPTVETARAAVAAARQHGADVVVGIGGGSVLDTGKAVAMLLGNGGDPLDYIEIIGRGQPITRPAPRSRRTRSWDHRSMAERRACAAGSCCRVLRSSIRCSPWTARPR